MKVIKIGAAWCSGCLVMRPRWQQIEAELPWLETVYYDYDQDQELIQELAVNTKHLPTFIFQDDDGHEYQRITGEVEKSDLIAIIDQLREREESAIPNQ